MSSPSSTTWIQVRHVGRVAAHRLQAVLQRRVEAAQAELALRRVRGQGADAEHVETGQLVDEVRDVGDVRRGGAALHARDRVDHVGRRRAGDHDGTAIRDGAVELRVAAAEREAGRRHLAVRLNDVGRELHETRLVVHATAVLAEHLAGLGVVGQDAHVLEDLQRRLVRALDLVLAQQLNERHGAHSSSAPATSSTAGALARAAMATSSSRWASMNSTNATLCSRKKRYSSSFGLRSM